MTEQHAKVAKNRHELGIYRRNEPSTYEPLRTLRILKKEVPLNPLKKKCWNIKQPSWSSNNNQVNCASCAGVGHLWYWWYFVFTNSFDGYNTVETWKFGLNMKPMPRKLEWRAWYHRAKVIYFCLHSHLGNGDKQLTAEDFSMPRWA